MGCAHPDPTLIAWQIPFSSSNVANRRVVLIAVNRYGRIVCTECFNSARYVRNVEVEGSTNFRAASDCRRHHSCGQTPRSCSPCPSAAAHSAADSGCRKRTGTWAGAYGNTVSWNAPPKDGTEVAEWTFNVVPGAYRLSTSLHCGASIYGSNNPVTVFNGSQVVGNVTLDQSTSYRDYFLDSTRWKQLGVFTVTSTLRVRMTDLGNGYIISDAFRIQRVADSSPVQLPAPTPQTQQLAEHSGERIESLSRQCVSGRRLGRYRHTSRRNKSMGRGCEPSATDGRLANAPR